MKSVTLKDIAKKFNVTEMTVSSALRGKGRMRKELRQEIVDYANRKGYRRNPGPSLIMKGRYHTVALLCSHNLEQSYLTMHMLHGMLSVLEEAGYTLTVIRMPSSLQRDEEALQDFFRDWTVDGVIVNYTHDLHANVQDAFERFRIPKVWINNRRGQNCVYYNDLAASRGLTERLMMDAEGPVFYVGNPVSHHHSAADRRQGYLDAMDAAGREAILLPSREPDHLREILARYRDVPHFSAVCYAPAFVYPLFLEGLRAGWPEEAMRFGSFDHIDAGGYFVKNMEICVLSSTRLGEETARMLLKRLKAPADPLPPVAVPPAFSSRSSALAGKGT